MIVEIVSGNCETFTYIQQLNQQPRDIVQLIVGDFVIVCGLG
jgi:hypothetical protein